MPRYHLSPLAEQDLEDIWLYTCDRWSLQQADDYHAGFVAAFEQIAAGQRHGQPVSIR